MKYNGSFGGKLDQHFDRQLNEHLAREEAAEKRQERIDELTCKITECSGEVYEAVDNDDSDLSISFWDEVQKMADHGRDRTDEKFIEAARGVYDHLTKLIENEAIRRVNQEDE